MENKRLLRYSAMGVVEYHWKSVDEAYDIMDRGADIGIGIRFASPEEVASIGHLAAASYPRPEICPQFIDE